MRPLINVSLTDVSRTLEQTDLMLDRLGNTVEAKPGIHDTNTSNHDKYLDAFTASKGCTVHGTHHQRDASSKGCIFVQGGHRSETLYHIITISWL